MAFVCSIPIQHEAKNHNAIVHTYAIGGTNTLQWGKKEKWIIAAIQKWRPEWVFVILGTNDAGVPTFKKNFAKNSKLVVQRAHKRNVKVVWITPPKIRINTDFIYEGATQSGADLVFDYREVVISLWRDKHGKPDVHPSRKGCIEWSKKIFNQFEQGLNNGQ